MSNIGYTLIMFTKFWEITCNNCGTVIEHAQDCTKAEANEMLIEDSGAEVVIIGEKHFCHDYCKELFERKPNCRTL